MAQSAPNNLTAELERLHNQRITAFDSGGGATMDRMEVPNLILVNADAKGGIWQKSGPRGKHKPTGVSSRTLSNTQVRQFGDCAILTGLLTTQGGPQASTTVVWVHQSGQWLIASAQWTEVAAAQK